MVGRFVSGDTMEMIALPTSIIAENNVYAYSVNNPTVFCDPMGYKAINITSKLTSIMRKNALVFATYIVTQVLFKGIVKGVINSFKYFYNNSKTGGLWDLKNKGWKLSAGDWYVFKGRRLRGDDPGNIHFGYVGSVMFPLWILRAGAGVYQIYSGTSRWSYWFTFFDDYRDSSMITWGHTLFICDIIKTVLKIIGRTRIRCYWL